jgi:hypothetical protein
VRSNLDRRLRGANMRLQLCVATRIPAVFLLGSLWWHVQLLRTLLNRTSVRIRGPTHCVIARRAQSH